MLTRPERSAVLHFSQDFVSTAAMADFFAGNGYQNPSTALDSPFTFGFNCKGTNYFGFLARPDQERFAIAFNETMALQRLNEEPGFVASYPVDRLRIEDPARVLFVDVGGGVGHQLLKFRERSLAAGMSGQYVLEDLPSVVSEAKGLPDGVVKVGHDFFQPQPESVRGAKAFYLRTVLHDWPKVEAEVVLRNIVDVMAEDSVVLLHETILEATQVEYFTAKLDWHLMNLGALERTEEHLVGAGRNEGQEGFDRVCAQSLREGASFNVRWTLSALRVMRYVTQKQSSEQIVDRSAFFDFPADELQFSQAFILSTTSPVRHFSSGILQPPMV